MPRTMRRLWLSMDRLLALKGWHYMLLFLLIILVIMLQISNWLGRNENEIDDFWLPPANRPLVNDENPAAQPREVVVPRPAKVLPDYVDAGDPVEPLVRQPGINPPRPHLVNPIPSHSNSAGAGGAHPPPARLKNVNADGRRERQRVQGLQSATRPPQRQRPFHLPAAAEGVTQVKAIDGVDYPVLTLDGSFVPIRRWIHLDLKGGAYRPPYFFQLLGFLKKIGANGVLLEWEDMFPFEGRLASARNGDAYTMEQVEAILLAAKEMQLEVVPLVQTFGHLEWILKLEEFSALREDPRYLNVICFGSEDAWSLVQEAVEQVAKVHAKYGMHFFHMGADEVYHVGVCNDSVRVMEREGGSERAMLWHISRTAKYIKDTFMVTVLAWHDMFVHVPEEDLKRYGMLEVLEPVLWSYAENLNQYLPYNDWMALRPFKRVWAASAFKGADNPNRFESNPIHYIRNHESWTEQMTRVYREFEAIQGIIMTGWSRYDHMAIMCELIPVAIPSLVMSMETILAGRPLRGQYEKSREVLQCDAPYNRGYVIGCQFPGAKVYELINEYSRLKAQIQQFTSNTNEFTGWMSNVAVVYNFSSPMYAEKLIPFLDYNLAPLERIEHELRQEMPKIYFNETVDEYILTYLSDDLRLLRQRYETARQIISTKGLHYPRRPFVTYASEALSPPPAAGPMLDIAAPELDGGNNPARKP